MPIRMRIPHEKREILPDSAFAYVDPNTGRRCLPIHDSNHTRMALIAVTSWSDKDSGKWVALKKIIKRAKDFKMEIPDSIKKLCHKEPWSVS